MTSFLMSNLILYLTNNFTNYTVQPIFLLFVISRLLRSFVTFSVAYWLASLPGVRGFSCLNHGVSSRFSDHFSCNKVVL